MGRMATTPYGTQIYLVQQDGMHDGIYEMTWYVCMYVQRGTHFSCILLINMSWNVSFSMVFFLHVSTTFR